MENNPRRDGKEHAKAIALRSGKSLKSSITPVLEDEEVLEEVKNPQKRKQAKHHKSIKKVVEPVSDPMMSNPSTTKIPFPMR